MGVIPTLVKLLGIHSHNTALTEMCLIAFGNLAELGEYICQSVQEGPIEEFDEMLYCGSVVWILRLCVGCLSLNAETPTIYQNRVRKLTFM